MSELFNEVLNELLEQLATINISGAPFLLAYGLTWLICGVLWKKVKNTYASLATLFQGMFALPAALLILHLIGDFQSRPDTGQLNNLVIINAMSQLLVLPLLIAMFKGKHYTLIPFVFSTASAVHFLMYSWLYQTPSYIAMSVIIAIGMSFIYYYNRNKGNVTSTGAFQACIFTSIMLFLNAVYLIFVWLQ